MLALDILHTLANLGCSSAGEQQQLYMVADRLAEHVIRDMLVVAACNENDLLLEGIQSCDGSRRTGGDGVVVILHAVLLAHELDAMLNAAERGRHGADVIVRGVALHDSRRHHHVVHVVRARNADIGCGHQLTAHAAVRDVDNVVLEEHAVGQLLRFAGAEQVAGRLERARHLVVEIENELVVFALIAVNGSLGLHILVKILVVVQMIGRQIGDRRNVRRVLHAHQLERGQLHDCKVVLCHRVHAGEQGRADIAAEMHGIARVLQNLTDERGGRGLAVRAGDADDRTRADREEKLHLAGDLRAVCARLLKKTRVNARGTEDNVLIERIKVMRAENEVYAEGSEGSIAVAKLGGFFFVMHGNAHACSAQHTDERHIAHARADYADPFIRQAAEVLF